MITATRILTLRDANRDIAIPINVHTPEQKAALNWICRFEIGWPEGTAERWGAGVDAIQAQLIALQMIGAEIAEIKSHTFPNGCHIAEVEVDPETGMTHVARYIVMDDVGKAVNPMIVRGQVHGGVAQGMGQAVLENTAYDSESGQLLAGSFLDYALPRADDLPDIEVDFVEVPCLSNPLGVKGAGEAGAVGSPPAVINAIVDALTPVGVTHVDMPATPEKLWKAISLARAA